MKQQKAYILAYQRATNYGAVLQIYALKKVLENFGLETLVIDYVPDWMKVSIKNKPHIKSYIKRKIMNYTFKSFFRKLNFTKKTFFDQDSLKNELQDGDFYFVGSDQVWNHKIMNNDTTYFLDFAPQKAKKIGYALSMGNQNFSNDFLQKVLPMINRFDHLSARETFVSNFIKKYNPECKVSDVLDPTLLLNAKDYSSIKKSTKFNSNYIVVYSAMHDENLYEYAKYLRQKTSLPLINLGYHFNGANKNEYIYGPQNWLNRMQQASFIITNSFHGTVFSILFKKQFLVVPNQSEIASGLNARFKELLESLQLNDRLIYSKEEIDEKVAKPVAFSKAFELLELRRAKSIQFIENAILK